jgi:hypothetical protein
MAQVLQECYVAATTKLGVEPLMAKEALVKLKASSWCWWTSP